MTSTPDQLRIAYLEARIDVLEAALARRSADLRLLQRQLCPRDLVLLARITAGLPPLPAAALDLELWRETTDLTSADVEETLRDLWRSLAPAAPPSDGTLDELAGD